MNIIFGSGGNDSVALVQWAIEKGLKDGRIIKLLCPVVDQNRSKFTYIIDGECVAIK